MASQDKPSPGPQGGLDPTVPHHHTAYKIIGVAMDIHNKLGPGHREEVYQQAMLQKLPEAGLATAEQVPVVVTLDRGDLLTYYLDLLIEQAVIVELKAHSHPLTNDDLAQVIDYLAATGFPVALLINFGKPRLEYRRILPPQKIALQRRRAGTRFPSAATITWRDALLLACVSQLGTVLPLACTEQAVKPYARQVAT